MRFAGTLANQHDAATFIDYLLTLGITAKAERNDAVWDLWIYDEDQLKRGREELASFQAAPQAPQYREAARAAEQIRTQRLEKELAARRNLMSVPRSRSISTSGKRPLTMSLLTMCGVVFLLISDNPNPNVMNQLLITRIQQVNANQHQWINVPPLPEVQRGQVWRLVTPIFLHFGPAHLIFNMLCLIDFGTQIELLRGWRRMLLMILLFAIPGNLAQYYFSGPLFGGMSGVLFGFFGYIWMKTTFEPSSGFFVQPLTVTILLVGFLVGVLPSVLEAMGLPYQWATGVIPHMANWCHGVGLALGMLLGAVPTLLRGSGAK
ncbi:MAG: rhomboid family intramembrane serine protease [Pirellulales bacterium]